MAEFTVFRDSIKLVSPTWLQGNWGYRIMYTMAVQLDATAEALRQGVLARMPGYSLTSESLPFIGNDKQIQRGLNESDASFIARCQAALTTWKIAGNAQSIIVQLLGYVSPLAPKFRYVVEGFDDVGTPIADWVTVEDGTVSFYRANPSNWDWDGGAPNWRYWLIIYPGVFDGKLWGDGHFYGDGTSWGYTQGPNYASDFRSLIKKWQCDGSQCLYLIVASDDSQFDPTSPPGPPMPDGDWDVPANRDPDALYILGT